MIADSTAANEMEVVMNADTQSSGQAVQLNDIGQIALTVRDLGRAKNFYQNTLGMKFLFDAGTMAFFQCGAIRLMIGLSEGSVAIGETILYFKVPDIQGVHGVLKDQGVTFVQAPHLVARMPDHDLWMAFLKDTEGNTLGLMSEVRAERGK
jgi:methylmalonyl-CoA/ethylmalonyl-CoA epimerase